MSRPIAEKLPFAPIHEQIRLRDHGQVRRTSRIGFKKADHREPYHDARYEQPGGEIEEWTAMDTYALLAELAKLKPHPRYAMTPTSIKRMAHFGLLPDAADYIATCLLGIEPERLWPEAWDRVLVVA